MFEDEIFKNTLYGIVLVQNVYSFYLHNIGIYLPKGEVKTREDWGGRIERESTKGEGREKQEGVKNDSCNML